MKQRNIYYVNLDPTIKTEIGKTRPAVIVSSNAMNKHYSRLIVLPITSKVERIYPFEVLIDENNSDIMKTSKIMVDQIRSIDKNRLLQKIGNIDISVLEKIREILKKLI